MTPVIPSFPIKCCVSASPPPSLLTFQHLSPSPQAEHIKAVTLLGSRKQTSQSHLERGLAVTNTPQPLYCSLCVEGIHFPWHCPTASTRDKI